MPIYLLGGNPDIVHDFISESFGARSALLPDSSREDRALWTRIRRRWLPHDNIDHILALNVSAASNGGPLRLGYDVILERCQMDDPSIQQISSMCADCGTIIDLPKVYDAFRDGFSVRIRHLNHRVHAVASATEKLRDYWHASVDSELMFAPPVQRNSCHQHFEKTSFHEFWVQLDGQQRTVVVLPDNTNSEYDLSEGDVLYVPPGARLSRKSHHSSISMHVHFSIGPLPTRVDGLKTAVDTMKSSVLDERLPGDEKFTWRMLVRSAIESIALAVPGMQLPLPVSPQTSNLIQQATGVTSVEVIRAELIRFVQAAEQSKVINPVLDFLSEKTDQLGTWARKLKAHGRAGSNTHEQIINMFHHCLRHFGSVNGEDIIRTMRSNLQTEEQIRKRMKIRCDELYSLQRHGEAVEFTECEATGKLI